MPDAHDAAVEAMAAALCAASHGPYPPPTCPCGGCEMAARLALAALVRSEAVRAALVAATYRSRLAPGPTYSADSAHEVIGWYVAAMLAALRPDEGDTDA